jgi:hypothetical protein
VPEAAIQAWHRLEGEYPSWPFFRLERRSAEIAEKIRRLVRHSTKRACIELERMDREYRQRQQ